MMSRIVQGTAPVLLLAAAALAQPLIEGPPPPTQDLQGLWPSPGLLDIMLQRWADQACEEYDLDPEQRARVRETVVAKWSRFLNENRSTIQPLANEFLEMRLDLSPPSTERVQAWAQRALPVFEKTLPQIQESQDDFRGVLRPSQRFQFEVDVLKTSASLALADQRLRQWKAGEFQPDDFWQRTPADRRARREQRRREARSEARPQERVAGLPVDQVAAELDRWTKYVADFSERFQLDDSQKNTAESCLRELRERAAAHRDRHRQEIDTLEQRIEAFEGDDAVFEDLKKRLQSLYGPIDDMFQELQGRLEPIPTAEQRAAVAAAASPPSTAPTPAPPSEKPPPPTPPSPQP